MDEEPPKEISNLNMDCLTLISDNLKHHEIFSILRTNHHWFNQSTNEFAQYLERRFGDIPKKPTLEWTISDAAYYGYFELVQYLHDNGECSQHAIFFAAQNGDLKLVRWLYHNCTDCIHYADRHFYCGSACTDFTTNYIMAMVFAAQKGQLHVLEWLHHIGKGCQSMGVDFVAKKGHLHILKWLESNSIECYGDVGMKWAARSGHLGVVKWLHRHGLNKSVKMAKMLAHHQSHDEIVDFLLEHYPDLQQ